MVNGSIKETMLGVNLNAHHNDQSVLGGLWSSKDASGEGSSSTAVTSEFVKSLADKAGEGEGCLLRISAAASRKVGGSCQRIEGSEEKGMIVANLGEHNHSSIKGSYKRWDSNSKKEWAGESILSPTWAGAMFSGSGLRGPESQE
ncbi:hypothetical protein Ancab_007754 [Ancistrocladus abbreviatus]